jgi:methionyl-tRNA formyltransferase
MRVAVIAGSLAAGIRVAIEVERLPTVDVYIVCCNLEMRSPLLRWLREFALVLRLFRWRTYIPKIWRYRRSGKLIVLRRSLEDLASVERLRALRCDVGLHTANVIYREPTIAAFQIGILNAHIGILPAYRGRSVAQWSVLNGDPTGITVFFIDSSIDTGSRIVLRALVPPGGSTTVQALKTMLFDFDARLYRQALEALESDGFAYEHNDVSQGKRYYVMSRLFTGVVNTILGLRTG